jgi:hypothetical protein
MTNGLEHFETQAAETLGAMKDLYVEFETRLGEVVAAQRLAVSEARSEGSRVLAALETIARSAQQTADSQRQAIGELRAGWQMHVAENSRSAGAEMARTFGNQIASGLQQRLEQLATRVETATHRFEWMPALKWGVSIGCAAVVAVSLMTITVIRAVEPQAAGVNPKQAQAAATHLVTCQVDKIEHTCIALEDTPRVVARGPHGEMLAVVRGM